MRTWRARRRLRKFLNTMTPDDESRLFHGVVEMMDRFYVLHGERVSTTTINGFDYPIGLLLQELTYRAYWRSE